MVLRRTFITAWCYAAQSTTGHVSWTQYSRQWQCPLGELAARAMLRLKYTRRNMSSGRVSLTAVTALLVVVCSTE